MGNTNPLRPAHYTSKGIEPIKFINSHNLNFNLGNVVKYIARRGSKDGEPELQDLQKARQYLDFEIARIKKEARNGTDSHLTEEESQLDAQSESSLSNGTDTLG